MITIYKYDVQITDKFEIDTYNVASPLSVQVQNGIPKIWMLVNTKSGMGRRLHSFYLYGTGNPISENIAEMQFVGTFQLNGFVWHLFYKAD